MEKEGTSMRIGTVEINSQLALAPMAGVTDAALRKSIREMDTNPTVFIVSQRTSSIQHADKIIVLDDGKIAGIGKHDELLNSCPVYSEIYNSQFKKEAV